jgi:CubicO group peptidase (beta-lactamase class C family)
VNHAVKNPRHEVLSSIVRELVVDSGVAPGGSAACARFLAASGASGSAPRGGGATGRAWQFRVGAAGSVTPDGRAVEPDTLYDLASVTKPFVAVTAARLAARGVLHFDMCVGQLFPELRDTPAAPVSLELLAAHRAGFEAHRRFFAPLVAGRPVCLHRVRREVALARRPDCSGLPPPGGFPPVYSDLGYLLLGWAIERATGEALDDVVEREVMIPLQLEAGSLRLLLARTARAPAPTEHVTWRGGLVSGMTHDENAWALAGHALAGHAGLFGTADDVVRFGAALIDAAHGRSSWLSANHLAFLVAPRPGGTLRAGFDGKSLEGSSAGRLASPDSFGHLGFTGTSLWCDPVSETVSVLLTNRVYWGRERQGIRVARPRVHDALASSDAF